MLLLAAVPPGVRAQATGDANRIVARFEAPPAAFDHVTNSAELEEVLRNVLAAEAAMPLDEPLQVELMGEIRDPVGGGAVPIRDPGLGFEVPGGQAASGGLGELIEASHGAGAAYGDDGWSAEETWSRLREMIEEGLTTSMAADGSFGRDENGFVPLKVGAVHLASYDDWELEDGLQRIYVKLQPGASFDSSMDGDWEEPAGFGYDIRTILLELEPPEATHSAGAVQVSDEALDRIAGVYEPGPGGEFEIRRAGDALVGELRRPGNEDTEIALLPLSETLFLAEFGGRKVRVSVPDEAGAKAVEITVEQDGLMQTWPRIR
jgi:hypothetical protein